MEKKTYHISGFDCGNCAAKTERHLNTKDFIESATLDFAANKLYISYKQEAISIDELKKVIKEVESDPLDIYELGLVKKVYHISSFDCGNCAAKAERHINTKENVESATLDFAANKLYITYNGNAWSLAELKKVIAEVEDDPLTIYEEGTQNKKNQKQPIFTKNMWFILGRVIFATIATLVCVFLLGKAEYNWLRFGIYLAVYAVIGYDILWKVILHIKNRTNPLDHNLLITVAAIGAFALCIIQFTNWEKHAEHVIHYLNSDYAIAMDHAMDAMMVIILFQIGRIIEAVATNKSKAAVMSAVELRVDTANLITEEGIKVVTPEELEVGQKILVKVGELIPVDGQVIDGEAQVDTSSLTGEFVPVIAKKEDIVFSGCLIKQGQITVLVKKIYADSTVSKIIELITSGGEKKSKADEFIAKFGRLYTPIVVAVAILVMLVAGLVRQTGEGWMDAVYEGLEILVTGCPCAIVISVPLAYFAAVGLSSKNGIVIKGASFLDRLFNLGVVVTDKTGTLTKGSFSIQHIKPNGIDEEELLANLYIVEALSNHPIGKAICHGLNLKKIAAEVTDFEEIAGFGVECKYKGKHILAGSTKMMKKYDIAYEEATEVGAVIYVAVDNKYLGYVVLSDEIKENAQEMVRLLHKEKIDVVLLTGDHDENAIDISKKLGIDRYHSQLLPEEKTVILEQEIAASKKTVAFVGDGINDAPSIIRSDVGIAMGGIGSDIAVENADIVIMNDDPAKIYDAVKISKIARHVAVFNIIFSLFVKIAVAVLVVMHEFVPTFPEIPMYVAVLADTGLTVVMVLNSLAVLYRRIRRK